LRQNVVDVRPQTTGHVLNFVDENKHTRPGAEYRVGLRSIRSLCALQVSRFFNLPDWNNLTPDTRHLIATSQPDEKFPDYPRHRYGRGAVQTHETGK
jgi:hypothetical protein